MPRYLQVAEYKTWARNDLPTDDNAVIEDAIAAAEMSLDNACGRRFELASGPATARLFRAYRDSPYLFIDDCTTVTAITDDTTTLVAADYQLEPLNGRSEAGEPVPYHTIRRTNAAAWGWNYDKAIISVTATWGWPAIPAQIREACKVLTKAHLDGRDIRAGIAGFSPDGFAVSEREARVVRQAIADYSLRAPLVA